MSALKNIETRCLNCGHWFPSPIGFGSMETFGSSSLSGNLVTCPHCRQMTPCNKENTRFSTIDGTAGFVGIDTSLPAQPATTIKHENKVFAKNETVVLDDGAFVGCKFDGCRIRYGGTGPVVLDSNSFSTACSWEFFGPAANTAQFLRQLHDHGGIFENLALSVIKGAAPGR